LEGGTGLKSALICKEISDQNNATNKQPQAGRPRCTGADNFVRRRPSNMGAPSGDITGTV